MENEEDWRKNKSGEERRIGDSRQWSDEAHEQKEKEKGENV